MDILELKQNRKSCCGRYISLETLVSDESCWYEGHITDDDRTDLKLGEILGVPEEYKLVCFLPVGRAAQEPRQGPPKKDFSGRAWFNGFGKESTQ